MEEISSIKYLPNNSNFTPLMAAAQEDHLLIVRYLIENRKINPNEATEDSETPLMMCVWKGHLRIVKYLIE